MLRQHFEEFGGGPLQEFVYERPETVADAVAALRAGDARALAGGTDLVPQLREGRRSAARIVDLKHVAAMMAIDVLPGGGVSIGAAATASTVARHPAIAASYPAVAQSARLIGGVQVQNRASLGGNICNAAPSADGVPALIGLAAQAVIAGPAGTRELAVEALFAGPGRTSLSAGELLVAIKLPPPQPRSAAAYLRFTPRREMDIAVAGSGAWLRLGADGAIAEARIVLASVAPTQIRAPSAERKIVGERPSAALFEEAGRLAARDARPISDTRGSADFRRTLVAVLTARALADCGRQIGVTVEVP
jgi:carbon-monoxide dehydrogenase medium subunit